MNHMCVRCFLGLVCVVLVGLCLVACAGPKPCQQHHDCRIKQRCDTSGVCMPGCGSDLDCPKEGDICDPVLRSCQQRPCPRGGKATSLGCLCNKDTDCAPLHRCILDKEERKHCLPICEPGEESPPSPLDRCVCPTGWELIEGRCQQSCPPSMARDKSGLCGPTLAQTYETWWERSADGALRLKCPKDWSRGSDGQCSQKPRDPPVALPPTGPQKPCPSDANDKWDEDYLKRESLPATTKVLYVDATATTPGTGAKQLPFASLTDAIKAADTGYVVLLAPGSYTWGHVLARSIHLVGRCPAQVRLEAVAADTAPGLTINVVDVAIEGISLLAKGLVDVGIDLSGATAFGKLRHVYIHGTKETGIQVAGKGMLLSHIEVTASSKAGITIGRDTSTLRIEHSLVTEHGTHGIRVAITDPTPVAEIDLRQNKIQANGGVGVEIKGIFKRVLLDRNLLSGNGKQSPAGGIRIEHDKGEVQIVRNVLEENLPTGIHAVQVDVLTMSDNLLRKNQHPQAFSAGVWVVQGQQVTISHNQIESYGSTGIRIDAARRVEIVGNQILDATQSNPLGAGIAIQPGGGSGPPLQIDEVVIEDNRLRRNGQSGIFVNTSINQVTISRNQIREVKGIGLQIGGPRRGFDNKVALSITHNVIDAGNQAAISIVEVANGEIKGNALSGEGQTGTGILSWGGERLVIMANVLKALAVGIEIQGTADVLLEDNIAIGPKAQEDRVATGIVIKGVTRGVSMSRNLSMDGDRGGLLHELSRDTKVSLTHNVWARQRHVGLSIRENEARVLMEGELFVGNGGRHLMLVNQGGEVAATACGFARATDANARLAEGWGKSAGNGIYVGAKGLVRWVFSKDKPPCPADQRGLSVALDEGWYARPMRVPHELDICQKWLFDMSQRSLEDRKKASDCDKCYQQNMGCRWIWKELKSGAPQGLVQRDSWGPDRVECTFASKTDSCNNPPKEIASYLPSVLGALSTVGQCEEHPQDPCASNGFCTGNTNPSDYCSREHRSAAQGEPVSYCALRSVRGPCHADRPKCPADRLCIAAGNISAPLNAIPASLTLKKSIFWANPGADIAMDQAGRVLLEGNFHYACPLRDYDKCPDRKLFQRKGSTTAQEPEWKGTSIPASKALVWQRPSPFAQAAFLSRLSGDQTESAKPTSLLSTPAFCDAYDFH